MPVNVAAAATLALAMLIATVGTICQVDAAAVPCGAEPCPAEADVGMALSPNHWEASLHRALRQTERGLLQMAGMAPAR